MRKCNTQLIICIMSIQTWSKDPHLHNTYTRQIDYSLQLCKNNVIVCCLITLVKIWNQIHNVHLEYCMYSLLQQ